MSVSRSETIRIVLVDDHLIVREGLAAMLAHRDDITLVSSVATSDEARAAVAEVGPDVVLVDINLRNESGLDLCRDLVAADPDLAVVCLTVHDEDQYLFEALRSGARGFLLKRVTPDSLVASLQAVLAGEIVVDPLLSGRVTKAAAESEGRGFLWPGMQYGLTKRESEFLQLVSEGFSNRELAEHTFVSEETVKSHLKSIYKKLSVSSRSEVVALALREGLVR